MHDDTKPLMAAHKTASTAHALRRIANALGVSVSSLGGVEAYTMTIDGPTDQEEAAVLATVQSYLKHANPAARDRFMAMVQAMVKLPSP